MITKISSLIKAYQSESNIKPREIAAYAGICTTEYYKKMRNANLWRLGEINAIYNFLKVPTDERIYEE